MRKERVGPKLPPGQVLDAARSAELATVVVVGREVNGELYLSASDNRPEEVVALLKSGRAFLKDAEFIDG